jgi:hypothetical protein
MESKKSDSGLLLPSCRQYLIKCYSNTLREGCDVQRAQFLEAEREVAFDGVRCVLVDTLPLGDDFPRILDVVQVHSKLQ